jgi:hypothetical protein
MNTPAHIDNQLRELAGIVALIGFAECVEADVAAFTARNARWGGYIADRVEAMRETAPCGYDWAERLEKLCRVREVV